MQVQRGSADCRLFALAFATILCAGDNPAHVNYTQHFALCSPLRMFYIFKTPFHLSPRQQGGSWSPGAKSLMKYFVCVDYRKMARWSSVANVWSGTTGTVLMLQRTSGIMMLCGIVVRANRLL